MIVKILVVCWTFAILFGISLTIQYFYDKWKNKTPKK